MQKKTTIIISVLALLVGLMFGYVIGDRASLSVETTQNEVVEPHSHGPAEMDEMMDMMMANLEGKTGAAFERTFLQDMIIHHEGAVEMARALLEESDRPELTQFGKDIISVQSREIEMMKTWLQEWFEVDLDEA